jgi:predicted nucleotidyltransferase
VGEIWVREFTGGLDTRRLPEATPGNALIEAINGHITRGGEFEKRAAFVPEYDLPAGTVGLAFNRTSVVVFGSAVEPSGLPTGVTYQRLEHPDSTPALVSVPSFDLYSGRIYAVGVFSDGSIHHYYDGAHVDDWYDGRASAIFQVTGAPPTPAVAASATLIVSGGTIGDTITGIDIAGVTITSGTINHTGSNTTTAAAIAADINSFAGSTGYSAVADGPTVVISAVVAGSAANGRIVTVSPTGTFAITTSITLTGGVNQLDATVVVNVDGVPLTNAPVTWTTSNAATAAAVAAAIALDPSTPDYTAIAIDDLVVVLADTPGAAPNGKAVTFDLVNGFTVDPDTGLTMTGGSEVADTYPPGTFAKTVGSKVYSTSGPNLHFSGIREPMQWTTDAVGAGFIDMSSQASGSEDLTAIAKYQNYVAIFAENAIQIEFVDPDPALNRMVQVLSNTGTLSPRSVTQFGDNDIFYLHESGLRSLQARDSSNSAATFDLGNPVDDLVTGKLATMSLADRQQVIGLIEPLSGRFWLVMQDTIFVFSFFNRAQISAWSTYTPSYEGDDGEQVAFDVEDAIVFRRRVYLRSGDTIYVFGGLATGRATDSAVAEAWLAYLDANEPTRKKEWMGIDAALVGEWEASIGMQPTNLAAEDKVSILDRTTYNDEKVPAIGQSTHISPRFRSVGSGAATLSSVVVHYQGSESED